MIELTGKNIIGHELSGEGKEVFFAVNPSNEKDLEPGFKEASPDEINIAVRKASAAFQVYRNKSGKEKAEFLESIGEEILSLGQKLVSRAA